eukprot:scaffold14.g1267.t1
MAHVERLQRVDTLEESMVELERNLRHLHYECARKWQVVGPLLRVRGAREAVAEGVAAALPGIRAGKLKGRLAVWWLELLGTVHHLADVEEAEGDEGGEAWVLHEATGAEAKAREAEAVDLIVSVLAANDAAEEEHGHYCWDWWLGREALSAALMGCAARVLAALEGSDAPWEAALPCGVPAPRALALCLEGALHASAAPAACQLDGGAGDTARRPLRRLVAQLVRLRCIAGGAATAEQHRVLARLAEHLSGALELPDLSRAAGDAEQLHLQEAVEELCAVDDEETAMAPVMAILLSQQLLTYLHWLADERPVPGAADAALVPMAAAMGVATSLTYQLMGPNVSFYPGSAATMQVCDAWVRLSGSKLQYMIEQIPALAAAGAGVGRWAGEGTAADCAAALRVAAGCLGSLRAFVSPLASDALSALGCELGMRRDGGLFAQLGLGGPDLGRGAGGGAPSQLAMMSGLGQSEAPASPLQHRAVAFSAVAGCCKLMRELAAAPPLWAALSPAARAAKRADLLHTMWSLVEYALTPRIFEARDGSLAPDANVTAHVRRAAPAARAQRRGRPPARPRSRAPCAASRHPAAAASSPGLGRPAPPLPSLPAGPSASPLPPLRRAWGCFMWALVPSLVALYDLDLGGAEPAADEVSNLWHVLYFCEQAQLDDLLVRAGGGRLVRIWLEQMLAAPNAARLMDLGWTPKAAWMLTRESVPLSVALLREGAARRLLESRFMGSSGMGSPAQSLRVMARPSFWARLKDEGLDEAGQPAPDMQPTAEIYNDVASAGTYCYPGCTTLRCATEAELHQSRLRKNKCAKCRMRSAPDPIMDPELALALPPRPLRQQPSWAALLRRHWPAYLVVALTFLALELVDPLEPAVRAIYHLSDAQLWQYSFPLVPDTVPSWTVPLISLWLPLLLLGAAGLAGGASCLEAHHACVALAGAVATTGLVASLAKSQVGRPRPDFVARCWPSGAPAFSDAGLPVCEEGVAHQVVKTGLRSFPSVHAAWSAAGLGFLALWLAGRLRCLCGGPPAPGRLLAALAPLAGAAWVFASPVGPCAGRLLDEEREPEAEERRRQEQRAASFDDLLAGEAAA